MGTVLAAQQDEIEPEPETKEEDLKEIKILFLDVDGVLNSFKTLELDDVDKELVLRLGNIIQTTGCKIVLSTTWRLDAESKEKLFKAMREKAGIPVSSDMDKQPNVYMGDTGECSSDTLNFEAMRSEEIMDSLNDIGSRYKVTHWAAVDDMKLGINCKLQVIDGFEDHFCQTDGAEGMTKDNMDTIIAMLSD